MQRISTTESDALLNDPPITGQSYVCLSFLSPETVILEKDRYNMTKYINHIHEQMATFVEQVEKEPGRAKEFAEGLAYMEARAPIDDYKAWLAANSDRLEGEYDTEFPMQCSVRGIKVRGVFATIEKAKQHVEILRDNDPHFDVFVAEVGSWCPWDPNPAMIQDANYSETELNTLMHKYNSSIATRKDMFENETQQRKQAVRDHSLAQSGQADEAGGSRATSRKT